VTARDVERFDRRAAGYDREWLQPRFFGPVRQATVDLAAVIQPDPQAVLDLGCGTGTLLRIASERFPRARLAGVDPAVGMLARAAAAGAQLVQAEAESLPFQDRTFDLVLSTLSLHHWGDVAGAVSEIARVLAPGGAVVLSDRRLPRRVDALLAAARLELGGRAAVFTLGPVTVVAAVCAWRPVVR
jgi:ubiquinone/menaquinone biosynthesis C-methylase UbiE